MDLRIMNDILNLCFGMEIGVSLSIVIAKWSEMLKLESYCTGRKVEQIRM